MPTLSPRATVFLLLASVNAIAYLVLPLTEGSLFYIGLKTSCCILLALFVQISITAGHIKKLLIAALLLSAFGDFFLAIRSTDYFIHGLGSFLIAHLLYISIFTKFKKTEPAGFKQRTLVAFTATFSIAMIALLWPVLGALKAPVIIYITVISLMAIAAILSELYGPLVVTGVFLFLISDATIAINKFLEPLSFANTLIWITYFLAQIFLTFAIFQGTTIKKAQTLQSAPQ